MRFHLAQVNVSRLLAPLDSERLRPFVERLERVNAAADAAPGFVWRLQTDEGDAPAVGPIAELSSLPASIALADRTPIDECHCVRAS